MKGKREFLGQTYHENGSTRPPAGKALENKWRSLMSAFEFPPEFRISDIATNGTSIYVRSGGTGPAVVLLHGYGETGDMWVTCFRAPRVKWPCQGVEGVKFIF